MFEDENIEKIRAEMMAVVPVNTEGEPAIDTRQGSLFFDATAGTSLKLAEVFVTMRHLRELLELETSTEDFLDMNGRQFHTPRNAATPAWYRFEYEGAAPAVGTRFFVDGHYFSIDEGPLGLYLVAEVPGEGGNTIIPGAAAVPVSGDVRLDKAQFGELAEPGVNEESDESYRLRIQEKLAGPAENGNMQHYKTWCEEVEGVGRARIVPLAFGENTVMGVLIGGDGQPATENVVARVQEYIDPIDPGLVIVRNGKSYLLGDGLGMGRANIGAHFLAISATSITVRVSVDVEVTRYADMEKLEDRLREAIRGYFMQLALQSKVGESIKVRSTNIGNMLLALDEVVDYHNLLINGVAANLELAQDEVAVLGEVLFNVV